MHRSPWLSIYGWFETSSVTLSTPEVVIGAALLALFLTMAVNTGFATIVIARQFLAPVLQPLATTDRIRTLKIRCGLFVDRRAKTLFNGRLPATVYEARDETGTKAVVNVDDGHIRGT